MKMDMSRNLRVLVVTKSFSKGGSATGAQNVVRALEAAGLDCFCSDAYATPGSVVRRGLRILERTIDHMLYDAESHCMRVGRPAFDLRELVEAIEPDVVQLCDVSGNVIAFDHLGGIDCPVVHRLSDLWPYGGVRHYPRSKGNGERIGTWLLRKTIFDGEYLPDFWVAPSFWLKESLSQKGIPRERIQVIRNAVELEAARTSIDKRTETLRLGFVASSVHEPRKGLAKLPKFLEALAAAGIVVELHVFGRGNRRESALPPVSSAKVVSHGSYEKSELSRVFGAFDILLCPSLFDNSPNVVCEALARGTPVIGQSGTGIDTYVNSSTGALVDFWHGGKRAEREFIIACRSIIERYNDVSSSASEFAATQLSYGKVGRAYRRLYSELLQE